MINILALLLLYIIDSMFSSFFCNVSYRHLGEIAPFAFDSLHHQGPPRNEPQANTMGHYVQAYPSLHLLYNRPCSPAQ